MVWDLGNFGEFGVGGHFERIDGCSDGNWEFSGSLVIQAYKSADTP